MHGSMTGARLITFGDHWVIPERSSLCALGTGHMLTICGAGWWGLGKSPTMLLQPGEAMLKVMLTL